ncbi:SLC13 family permease [Defluviimonas sp. WL0050]|uniref:SLC13 family permease n=1 Tax=Albidovulum litorale TaxID=2984134 RepID=A0ABT2ZND3_9RHOB|nr:SLC13 family permease [Defluviimonas sp. WL0050]MCV2872644.1 SLC13 family permease [Defluviimonas sp. WL0050]
MTADILIVLSVLVVAILLLATEWISVDVVTLGLVAALTVTGILSPAEAFAGFGSEVIVILASIMVLAGAIVKAGAMDRLAETVHAFARGRKTPTLLALLSASAASSAFLSNTNVTAIMTPVALGAARKAGLSAGRVLMPVAYASILGGTCTIIGTSTNLAGSAMVERLGMEPFSLFEFLGIGLIVAAVGIFWLVFGARWVLPVQTAAEIDDRPEPRRFFTTLCLPDGSSAIGRPVREVKFEEFETDLLAVVRNGERFAPHHSRKLQAGDELIVRASREGLVKLKKSPHFTLEPDRHFSERFHDQKADVSLVEALIAPQSRLVGQTLKQLGFFDEFRGVVLAIYRRNLSRPARIENMRLRAGDVLLLQGPEEALGQLRGGKDLRVLVEVDETAMTRREGLLTLGALTAAIVAGALGLVPFSVAVLIAVLTVVLSGGITMEQAYRSIDWRLLILIGGMTSLGVAMETSGAARFLADHIVGVGSVFGPRAAMAAFALLAIVLTQPMSNAAAALTVMPVAVAAAPGLGLEPRTLAVLVTLSASLSFISPLEPACLLVYDLGRYRFMDYVRAGTPLTLISLVLLLILVPVFWP